MGNFRGIIVEESLENKGILKKATILNTAVEEVTPEDNTPYLKQWTMYAVEIKEDEAEDFAKELSDSLDAKHSHWYADFKNEKIHYIIFRNKIFKIDRSKPKQYEKVVKYGVSLGIPQDQLDFSPDII